VSVNSPLITAVIPTYRRPKLLKRAILSVLRQTYENIQVCVYDNDSGDNTAEMVAEIANSDDRVKYHCHSTNIGMISNINYGISQVNTPLFSILSDDDVMLPDFYAEALRGLEIYPEAIFSAGSVVNMTQEGQVIGVTLSSWPHDGYFSPPEGLYAMLGGRHPIMTAILFRREVIDIYGGIDPDIVVSDLDFEVRIAARFPFVISKRPCGIFVAHPLSAGIQADTSWVWPSCLKLIQNLMDDSSIALDIRENVEQHLVKYFKNTIFILGLRSAIRGNFVDTRKSMDVLDSHYRAHTKATILRLTTQVFEHVQFIHRLAHLSYDFREVIYGLKNAKLQKEYGHLAKFLELG
jgi:glycosyltransferase involved in cell wall biosynthesis